MQIGQHFNPYKMFIGSFIPNIIMRYKDLSPGAKLCYARLAQYAGEDGIAYPSHKKIGEEMGVSARSARRYIDELTDKNFIKTIHRKDDEGRQTSNSYAFLWHELLNSATGRSDPTSTGRSDPTSTTWTDPSYKDNHSLRGSYKESTIPYSAIINHLNQVCGTQYKPASKATQRFIKARWNEGYRIEDFKAVIDTKAAQWKKDKDYSKYLRPQTLFSPKFEAYLNERKAVEEVTYS